MAQKKNERREKTLIQTGYSGGGRAQQLVLLSECPGHTEGCAVVQDHFDLHSVRSIPGNA